MKKIKKFLIVLLLIIFSFGIFGKITTKELNFKKIKVLMVVSNPTIVYTTNWPVGFWASELIHPYYEFINAGYEVIIVSPKGGKVEFDVYSKADTLKKISLVWVLHKILIL